MKNNILLKYSGGANRRRIGLGAFIEARGVADAAVAGLKAAASSYTDLVRGGVARECGSSCVSECLHLSAINRLVARIREAQAVVPGAIRRLVEIGLDAVVDAETRSALALRPADFVRIDRDWLDGASCSDVETAARALGVRRPTGKDDALPLRLVPRAGAAGVPRGARPRLLAAQLLPLLGDRPADQEGRAHGGRRPHGRPEGLRPGRRLARHNQPARGPSRFGGAALFRLSKPASAESDRGWPPGAE